MQQLITPKSKPLDPRHDLFLSFFVPERALVGGQRGPQSLLAADDMDGENATMSGGPMVEIVCQVRCLLLCALRPLISPFFLPAVVLGFLTIFYFFVGC